jgi:UDP-glucose 4-epimerase
LVDIGRGNKSNELTQRNFEVNIYSMKKILITGGAGYIGSHAVLKGLISDYKIVVVDNLEKCDMTTLNTIKKITDKPFVFYKADLRDFGSIDKILRDEQPEFIIHFAGYKSVSEGELKPKEYFENNVGSVDNLIKAMEINQIENIIFSSTAAVYGNPKYVPVDELTDTKPINVYGQSKLKAEQLLIENCKKNPNFNSTIFRYFNVVGNHESGLIGEDPSLCTNLLPVIFETVLGNKPQFELFGNSFDTQDGSQERDYIDINDLVDAHFAAIKKNLKGVNIINLSTAIPSSCKKVIDIIESVTKVKPNYKVAKLRAGDPIVSYSKNKLAKELLGWIPLLTLEQSIINQWKWIQFNDKGQRKSIDL